LELKDQKSNFYGKTSNKKRDTSRVQMAKKVIIKNKNKRAKSFDLSPKFQLFLMKKMWY
jgi:hypothetical protein